MTKNAYKGPWTYREKLVDGKVYFSAPSDAHFGFASIWVQIEDDEGEEEEFNEALLKTAQLIKKSPDMLAMLEKIHDETEDVLLMSEIMELLEEVYEYDGPTSDTTRERDELEARVKELETVILKACKELEAASSYASKHKQNCSYELGTVSGMLRMFLKGEEDD
jgi:hypothetical protein